MKRVTSVFLLIPLLVAGQARPREAWEGGNLPVHGVGANDLLSVSVVGAPELSRSARIGPDGSITLPLLKQSVKVAGLAPTQIEQRIAAALGEQGLFVDPVVTVTIMEYASRPINVTGAVRKPLTFQATGRVRLLDAIAKAEGLSPEAGPEVLVATRPSGEGAPPLARRINIKELMAGAEGDLNIELQGGEEVRVPEAGKVFVVGNVRKPGAFAVHDGDGLSVLKLLALSEGLLPFTSKHAYVFRRESSAGERKETSIPIRDILARKTPDLSLRADDILYVPDNQKRRMSMATLERVISFGSTTASGLLIWGAAR